MIDNRTTNKNYPLPHPSNIASQDVERISTAITSIDTDIHRCSNAVDSLDSSIQELDAKALRIPSELVGTIDTELKDIAPRKYIVVNDTATGFSTVEGGGGEGGKKGEVLIKKSETNFDTTWVDPRVILKRSPSVKEIIGNTKLKNNSINILTDTAETDGNDLVPRSGLNQRQITSDVIGDTACTYLLADNIDNSLEEESDIASASKFGRVKIGEGIEVNNGTISVPVIGKASTSDFGLVQIGAGLNINNGVVSAQTYPHADSENFGIVKPGEDFIFGADGSLQLADQHEDIIYQKANVREVKNGVIKVVSTCAYYRTFINEDMLFSFDWSDLDMKDDISFDLEIVTDKLCVVNFGNNIDWEKPCAAAPKGTTIVHFERLLGSDRLSGDLVSSKTPYVQKLIGNLVDYISGDAICRHNGAGKLAYLYNQDQGWRQAWKFLNPNGGIFEIDFLKSTYIESIYVHTDGESSPYFYVEGSVDGVNWKRLLERTNVSGSPWTMLDEYGFFRYYRIQSRGNNQGLTMINYDLNGYSIEDDLCELEKVIPVMTANEENGYIITSSTLNSGALYNITNVNHSSYAKFTERDNGKYWIKYELPEAQSVDLIDIMADYDNATSMPTWYKIEASNDDENWDILIERAFIGRWYSGESKQFWIYNSTPYKYYKITSIESPSGSFCIARFRLYKRVDGKIYGKKIPVLSSSSQGGFEVKASSNSGGEYYAQYAFDGNINSKWVSAWGGGVGGWIQVKFPVETLCSTVWLRARNDNWYGQAPSAFDLLGSLDGINFEIIKTITGQTWGMGEEKKFTFFNETPYLYYRVQGQTIQNGETYLGFSEVNWGSELREYKRDINIYNYLIPKLTSNTSEAGYVASASSEYDNSEGAWRAFDGTGRQWTTRGGVNRNVELKIALPEARKCDILVLKTSDAASRMPRTFRIEASNDNSNWTVLYENLEGANFSTYTEYHFENPHNDTAFQFYRLFVLTNNGDGFISLNEFQLIEHIKTREY